MNDRNSSRRAAARRAISENPVWYHTIELAEGIVTPGQVDLRGTAPKLLPGDLAGKRALDVGTFDGFWAFEMERRGAEVVAIDVDDVADAEWPPANRPRLEAAAAELEIELGKGFRLAAEALGSQADRRTCDVYELDQAAIDGPVDLAFSGAILLHLRDPVRALERIRAVLAADGELRILEPFSTGLTLRSPRRPAARFQPLETSFNWWLPNLACLRGWLLAAGFRSPRRACFVRPPSVRIMRQSYVGLVARGGG